MRITPFRTILHAVAYKLGLDPDQDNFLTNQAIPIGTYINQWVDRVYSARDWPEWTVTQQFSPDSNHIVPWSARSSLSGNRLDIGRVLKVYLIDPVTTDAPIDTHYTLRDVGIHCGFEHGSNVWIRFLTPCPVFTAEQWDAARIYKAQDVAYSYTSGECYRSKVSGNVGHDPGFSFSPAPDSGVEQAPIELDTEIVVPLEPFNPGLPETSKIVRVSLTALVPGPDPGNPPPALSQYEIHVENPLGTTVALALTNPNGTDTLDVITTALANQLIGTLGVGWTITPDTNVFSIDIEHASDFYVPYAWFTPPLPPGSPISKLKVSQIRAYTPSMGKSDGVSQVIQFPLSPDQVTPGVIYTLSFKDTAGGDHTVSYTAGESDGATQILSQLINEINTTPDDFFRDVSSTLDSVSPSSLHATPTAVSLNATMTLPGSPWWELVPFPSTIQNQVIRGAYADLLKEWSQTDKGTAEEGRTTDETAIAEDRFEVTRNPQLTGQQTQLSRYKTLQ